MQIPRCRADVRVPQDGRQRGNVTLVLRQEARRKAMPQGMGCHRELDSRPPRRLRHHPLHIAGIKRAMSPTEKQQIACDLGPHLQVGLQGVPGLRRQCQRSRFQSLALSHQQLPQTGSQFDIADFEASASLNAQAGTGQHVDQRDIALSAPMRAIHSVDEPPQIARVQRIYWLLDLLHALDLERSTLGAHDGADWRQLRVDRGGLVALDAGQVDAVVAYLIIGEERGIRLIGVALHIPGAESSEAGGVPLTGDALVVFQKLVNLGLPVAHRKPFHITRRTFRWVSALKTAHYATLRWLECRTMSHVGLLYATLPNRTVKDHFGSLPAEALARLSAVQNH